MTETAHREWIDYLTKRLAEAESRLTGFDNAVALYGRVLDANSDQDVTEQERKGLQELVEDYRRQLRDYD